VYNRRVRCAVGWPLLIVMLALGLAACTSDLPCGCLCAPRPDGALLSPCSTIGPPDDFDGGLPDAPFAGE